MKKSNLTLANNLIEKSFKKLNPQYVSNEVMRENELEELSLEELLEAIVEEAKTKEKEKIKKIEITDIKNMKKNQIEDYSKRYDKMKNKYGYPYNYQKESTIFNSKIFRFLLNNMENVDYCIFNFTLKKSIYFPKVLNDDIKLIITFNNSSITGFFDSVDLHHWISHVGEKSTFKSLNKTCLRIIKTSTYTYKVIVNKNTLDRLLEVRSDYLKPISKENNL